VAQLEFNNEPYQAAMLHVNKIVIRVVGICSRRGRGLLWRCSHERSEAISAGESKDCRPRVSRDSGPCNDMLAGSLSLETEWLLRLFFRG
jgi:hypothetical protein